MWFIYQNYKLTVLFKTVGVYARSVPHVPYTDVSA